MAKKETLQSLAATLIERLKKAGIIVQRYDAYSTNSIYLKLDYGVANTVRISDHTGKDNLSYRYNLMTNLKKYEKELTDRGLLRTYWPMKNVESLAGTIIKDRQEKIRKYGSERYNYYMKQNIHENQFAKGFWAQAVLV